MGVEILKDGTINIGNWQDAISQSSLSGFSDMLGVNISNNPGAVSINFKFNKILTNIASVTFAMSTAYVANLSSAVSYRGNTDGIAVKLTTTGTLPAGLALNTVYYLHYVSATQVNFASSLKNLNDGTYVQTTDTGTGTHTINVITPKQITGSTKNSQGRIFYLDYDGRVWFGGETGIGQLYLIDGNSLTGATGNGIIFYKGYILVFSSSYISALKDIQTISETVTWTNNFITKQASSSNNYPFLSVNDDFIYFGDGNPTVGSYYQISLLEEAVGKVFNPTNSSTYTYVAGVATIPNENGNGMATSIKELNEYLVIGTNSNKIFFWDKKSQSFTSFITLQESGVNGIEIINNVGYATVGINGYIYVFNTSSVSRMRVIPEQISNQYYGNLEINFKAISSYQQELLFSVKIGNNSYLMSYNIETKKVIKKNISSFGETLNSGYISHILTNNDNIIIGSSYYNTTSSTYSYAVESLLYNPSLTSGTYSYYVYDNYEANIITELISYGDVYSKKTIKEICVSLLRPLIAYQGIKISYRRDDNSSWTVSKTIDYTTYSGFKEIKVNAPITDIIDLQIKIELDGIDLTSPILKTIRLIP